MWRNLTDNTQRSVAARFSTMPTPAPESLSLHRGVILLWLAIALTVAGELAAQPAITPGGVQPQLQRPEDLPRLDDEIFSVPPVVERPLDTSDGPVIAVDSFQLNFYVDGTAAENAHEEKLIADARALLAMIRAENNGRFTIGQLQDAANQVSQLYRRGGYLLATAFVPQQEVTQGIVVIDVLVGRVGKVSAAENSLYSEETIRRQLGDVEGKKLEQQRMETALLRVDDLPGLEAFGVFRPGTNLGEADLEIRADKTSAFDYRLIVDNYGTESTGELRLIGGVSWNNPAGAGDQLNVTALKTFDPSDSTYGAISYSLPLTNRTRLGFGFSTNDYQVGREFANLDFDGDTAIYGIDATTSIVRTRGYNLYNTLSLTRKQAELSFAGTDFEDDLTVVAIEFGYDKVDRYWGGGFNEGAITVSFGLDDFLGSMDKQGDSNALRNGAGGDFNKIQLNYSRFQNLSRNQSLLFRLQGQYSDDVLTSLEQLSLGGPNSVRAYTVSEYVRDHGYFTSLAWIINAPGFADQPAFAGRNWGEVLSVSLFVDYAKGRLNEADVSVTDPTVELSGAGISVELNLPDSFFIRLDAATPLGSLDASDDDNPQFWLSAGLQF